MPEPTTLTIGAAGISSLIGAVWSIAKGLARLESLEKRIADLEAEIESQRVDSQSLLRAMQAELHSQRILLERLSARLGSVPRHTSDAPTAPITLPP